MTITYTCSVMSACHSYFVVFFRYLTVTLVCFIRWNVISHMFCLSCIHIKTGNKKIMKQALEIEIEIQFLISNIEEIIDYRYQINCWPRKTPDMELLLCINVPLTTSVETNTHQDKTFLLVWVFPPWVKMFPCARVVMSTKALNDPVITV